MPLAARFLRVLSTLYQFKQFEGKHMQWRQQFERELESIIPELQEIYRLIQLYQLNPIARSAMRLKEKLQELFPALNHLRPYLPEPQHGYILAMGESSLPIEDRLVALHRSVENLGLAIDLPAPKNCDRISSRLRETLATFTLCEDDFAATRPPRAAIQVSTY